MALLRFEDIVVHKFGGSCLRDSNDIRKISEIINKCQEDSIVVVSALWGTTDRLIRAANEPRYATRLVGDLRSQHLKFSPTIETSNLSKLFNSVLEGINISLDLLSKNPQNKLHYNSLLASGERLSALIVANELQLCGIEATPIGSEDIGLRLDGVNSALHVNIELSKKILDYSALKGVPVITGWFGEGNDGNLALLSRGGSDHSAAAIARILDAKKLILWKDVEGIYSLNPRWGIETKPIPYLGYQEATELTAMDAPVVHYTTMKPLKTAGIPIEIRNLNSDLSQNAPTVIGPDISSDNEIKAIACLSTVSSITIEFSKNATHQTNLEKLNQIFDQNNILNWYQYNTDGTSKFVVSKLDYKTAEENISSFFKVKHIQHFSAMISLIGSCDNDCFTNIETNTSLLNSEILNDNNHSTTLLVNTDNIQQLVKELSSMVLKV